MIIRPTYTQLQKELAEAKQKIAFLEEMNRKQEEIIVELVKLQPPPPINIHVDNPKEILAWLRKDGKEA